MKNNSLRISAIVIISIIVSIIGFIVWYYYYGYSVVGTNISTSMHGDTNNQMVIVSSQKLSLADETVYVTIMYDPDTLVMYQMTSGRSGYGFAVNELTPLYNADGSLRTYSE